MWLDHLAEMIAAYLRALSGNRFTKVREAQPQAYSKTKTRNNRSTMLYQAMGFDTAGLRSNMFPWLKALDIGFMI